MERAGWRRVVRDQRVTGHLQRSDYLSEKMVLARTKSVSQLRGTDVMKKPKGMRLPDGNWREKESGRRKRRGYYFRNSLSDFIPCISRLMDFISHVIARQNVVLHCKNRQLHMCDHDIFIVPGVILDGQDQPWLGSLTEAATCGVAWVTKSCCKMIFSFAENFQLLQVPRSSATHMLAAQLSTNQKCLRRACCNLMIENNYHYYSN